MTVFRIWPNTQLPEWSVRGLLLSIVRDGALEFMNLEQFLVDRMDPSDRVLL